MENDRRERARQDRLRRKRQMRLNFILFVGLAAMAAVVVMAGTSLLKKGGETVAANASEAFGAETGERIGSLEIEEMLIPPNPYSRPGTPLEKVTGIVVHYTANPGTSAKQNRNYFAGLAETHTTSASSHYIIGLEGEIVQCVPLDEIAYATKERNVDTISIECCIEDDTGQFNAKTYDSLVALTAGLMGRYGLDIDAVIRHYDVTGKICPKYYVENEGAWRLFKSDVEEFIQKREEQPL